MKISDNSISIGQQAYAREVEAVKPPETGKAEAKSIPEDKVSLSKDARDMQVAKNAVEAAPEIREDAVQAIKNEVDNSTYKIDSQQIADKMIGTIINKVV